MVIEPRHIVSNVRKHKLITLATVIIILLCGFILSFMLSLRTAQLPELDIEIPPHYRPGQPLPLISTCTIQYHSTTSDLVGCVDRDAANVRYFIQFDITGNVITRTSKYTGNDNITLGDIILRWGEPTGSDSSIVRWGNRSVYISRQLGLAPSSKIYFVTYNLEPETQNPWRGFVNETPYLFTVKLPTLAAPSSAVVP
jgi:hypothetical protein